jgi:hypothetical protein
MEYMHFSCMRQICVYITGIIIYLSIYESNTAYRSENGARKNKAYGINGWKNEDRQDNNLNL